MKPEVLAMCENQSANTMSTPKFKFNWGALCMPLQFGFANKAYLCFLSLVPLISLIWPFVCGFCGEKWAYNSGNFSSVEAFDATMRSWNRAGLFSLIVCVVGFILYLAIFAELIAGVSAY